MVDELLLMFGSMFSALIVETIFLLMLIFKTPALKFLWASFKKRMILIHPRENHYIEFVPTKQSSSLAFVKGRGYYVIDPSHVYIESSTKLPCTLVYGNYALTIDPKTAKLAERLASFGLGMKFYKDIENLREQLTNTNQSFSLKILGESIDLSEAINFFNTSERSDFIEAEIQRRTASQVMAKLAGGRDVLKWSLAVMVILIGAAIAYAILSQFLGGPSPSQAIQGISRIISPVPVNTTPTAVS